MPSFKDRAGAVALPTLDADGNVPVRVGNDGAAGATLDDVLLELRAVRVGLEVLNNMKAGSLVALALGEG